ncbi:two-component system, NtrC family, C4-dicarboxylate transport sensor histidine kinase DctB [Marinospirillum celere]|uniref:C4-dicarboxylate transport sensor protein DctB n=1 Tax=Marinospirillum celere TaxID=1122252 RepID=A0A1I1J586_9GAMM|nr:ATP-binding protein [Marinospirillum celere]SFC41768.1 two-component system, NtrC family, C4-dicarboxylate transport sensor histidine kinase DctB [Marinospirillum celere]
MTGDDSKKKLLQWKWLHLTLILFLALLLLWQTAQLTWRTEVQRLEEQAHNELLLHVTALQGKLEKYEYLPELLTTKEDLSVFLRPDVTADELQQLNLTLDSYRVIADVSDIYLMDQDGYTVAASNWWRPDSFVGQNFSFRPYFQMAMQGKQGRFYGLGTTSGARGYYFSFPVYFDDEVQGALVVKIEIHAIEDPWRDPAGELLVTDPDGVIFISSRPEWRLLTKERLSRAELQRISDSLRYAGRILRPLPILENERVSDQADQLKIRMTDDLPQDYLLLSQTMPDAGWEVHMMKKLDPVRKQTLQSTLLAGFTLTLLAFSAFYLLQRRRVVRERQTWKEEAHQALQAAHDELESRVAARTADLSASNRRLLEEIHQHQRTEATLRSTQKELIQTAKLAVLGQLSASINHELNQPLAALRSYAENARTFIARNRLETADSNLEQILELTERMAEISAQLKMFSRKSGDQLVSVSVQAACDYALRLYQNQLEHLGVKVEMDFPEQEVFVLADMVRLEQVLVNLLSNALHAIKNREERKIRFSADYQKAYGQDWVRIQVWDTGPGIEPQQLEEIFDPFVTSKEPGQGLGLGLSISSRIAQDLNGKLVAGNHLHFRELLQPEEATIFTGAVFSLWLPANFPESPNSITSAAHD